MRRETLYLVPGTVFFFFFSFVDITVCVFRGFTKSREKKPPLLFFLFFLAVFCTWCICFLLVLDIVPMTVPMYRDIERSIYLIERGVSSIPWHLLRIFSANTTGRKVSTYISWVVMYSYRLSKSYRFLFFSCTYRYRIAWNSIIVSI